MDEFDSLNQAQAYAENAILFVGSSSIRLWDNIEKDMSPYPVIQRGYGGAAYTDMAYYIDRIVLPHQFEALVLFAGNDIWGNEMDTSPKEIGRLLKYIIRRVNKSNPGVAIFVIEVTHVPVREHLIESIEEENEILEAVCNQFDQVHWIATRQIYLTSNRKVNGALFGPDNIHQNQEGYHQWTQQIKTKIRSVLN